MQKKERIDQFQKALELSHSEMLQCRTRESAEGSRVYREGFFSRKLHKLHKTRLEVKDSSLLAAAAENSGLGPVAILNAANPHFPGGAVEQGGSGPEEQLCRASNLYPCLSAQQVYEDFYGYHRTQTDHDFSDRLIYTKQVVVFQTDEPQPRESWFRTDVITCAAPYLAKRRFWNRAVLKAQLKSRIRNILEAAMDHEIQVLILGAFGCGGFQNPPELVALAFREVLGEERYFGTFRQIVFAMGGDAEHLEIFRKILLEAELPEEKPRKQFSILGDAISTLEGCHPRGCSPFYAGENSERSGVRDLADTWWGRVISACGGELLVNDSRTGSRVARPEARQEQFPAGCSDRRTGELHRAGVNPDVILVQLGTNDWANGVPLDLEDATVSNGDTCFSLAYGLMLHKLRRQYPKAEIWCCTLARTAMASNPGFRFPENFGGTSIREYNRRIRNGAMANGCGILELWDETSACDTLDGTHPTAVGMAWLSGKILGQLSGTRNEIPVLLLKNAADGKILPVEGFRAIVGRSRESDVVLENGYVARSQATFTNREGKWYLRDNKSRNGTYINDQPLVPERDYPICPGDRISFAKKETFQVLQ